MRHASLFPTSGRATGRKTIGRPSAKKAARKVALLHHHHHLRKATLVPELEARPRKARAKARERVVLVPQRAPETALPHHRPQKAVPEVRPQLAKGRAKALVQVLGPGLAAQLLREKGKARARVALVVPRRPLPLPLLLHLAHRRHLLRHLPLVQLPMQRGRAKVVPPVLAVLLRPRLPHRQQTAPELPPQPARAKEKTLVVPLVEPVPELLLLLLLLPPLAPRLLLHLEPLMELGLLRVRARAQGLVPVLVPRCLRPRDKARAPELQPAPQLELVVGPLAKAKEKEPAREPKLAPLPGVKHLPQRARAKILEQAPGPVLEPGRSRNRSVRDRWNAVAVGSGVEVSSRLLCTLYTHIIS